MNQYNILNPFVPCGALIFLDEDHRSNTYCCREHNHPDEGVKGFPGGHNIVSEPPTEKHVQAA